MEALSEKIPSEHIEGVVYSMSPVGYRHSKVCLTLAPLLKSLILLKKKSAEYELTMDVWVAPSGASLVAPDIAVFEKPIREFEDKVVGIPVFVAEILSPSTGRKDRTVKKDYYEKLGIKEYWIVDPKNNTIDVYKHDGNEYKLDDIYQRFYTEEWLSMSESEKTEHPQLIKIDFLGVEIDVKDVFED